METSVCLCDLCLSDGALVLALGTYTTDEGNRFHACGEHLEEVKGYGFSTRPFEREGNISRHILP